MGCQRCPQHSHTARHVRSTAHANNRFSVRCSPPLYLSRKNASFQAGFGPIHTLLDIYPVYWDAILTGCQDKMHMPPGYLEVDELPVTHCLWRWTKHLRRKLEVEDVKHEAHCHWYSTGTTALLGPVHNGHSRYAETHEFPSACDPRQNGVSPVEGETHTPHHRTGEENREGPTA